MVQKIRKILISFFSASLIFSASQVYAEASVNRISGLTRYETAVAISKNGWTTSDNIVIAMGEDFPDALCAAPLAKKMDAPILLTTKGSLSVSLINEITRLNVKNAYIIGGQGVISDNVENQLKSKGISCKRLFGANRYETSIAVAKEIGNTSEIVVVSGSNFPDALSIAPIAAKKNIPIVLMPKDSLSESFDSYMLGKNISKSYIIGGPGVISEQVAAKLPNNERVYGDNRFSTNIAVLSKFSSELDLSSMYFATGNSFPDALAGSALAPKTSSPLILVSENLADETKNYLYTKSSEVTKLNLLGGVGVVSSYTVTNIQESMKHETVKSEEEKFIENGSVKINLPMNDVVVGDKIKVAVDITNKPSKSTAKVEYYVSDPSVALIDDQGNLTILKEGNFYVRVTYLSKTDSKDLTGIAKGSVQINSEKDLYNAVKGALIKGNDTVNIVTNNTSLFDKYMDVVSSVVDDCADYGDYIKSWSASYDYIKFNYSISKDSVAQNRAASDEKAKQIINSIIKPGMTELQKETAIHDYIVNNSKYDYNNYKNGTIPEDSYSSYGVLVKGTGVCASYAKAMVKLSRLAGLECYYVTGTGNGGPHAWNIVKVDDKYYQVDATFDDPIVNGGTVDMIRHSYFNISDDEMGKDHTWDRTKYPACIN